MPQSHVDRYTTQRKAFTVPGSKNIPNGRWLMQNKINNLEAEIDKVDIMIQVGLIPR